MVALLLIWWVAWTTSSSMLSDQINIQGQIDLSEVGKRGYHIPKKGTVQVVSSTLSVQNLVLVMWSSCMLVVYVHLQTLLNPNKTVVKIYFVKYNFSDMPPNSHTFLRHKTLSRPYHGSPVPAIPVLHYLIHLRCVIQLKQSDSTLYMYVIYFLAYSIGFTSCMYALYLSWHTDSSVLSQVIFIFIETFVWSLLVEPLTLTLISARFHSISPQKDPLTQSMDPFTLTRFQLSVSA